MKLLVSTIVTLCTLATFGQTNPSDQSFEDSSSNFRLTLSTFNHAERIFKGNTSYLITKDSVLVKRTSFGDSKGKVLYYRTNPSSRQTLDIINNIRLDTLKDSYFNYCVLVTSGNEYFLGITTPSLNKKIDLHHYYLKQIDRIVNLINSNIPEEYQLRYLPSTTDQDCKL